jgi:murein DD-endopeptidase MepM/ murein hydrolase activator NlpD
MMDRRGMLIGVGVIAAAGVTTAAPARTPRDRERDEAALPCSGVFRQGGVVIGRTRPHTKIVADGKADTVSSPSGLFIVGVDRDAGPKLAVSAQLGWDNFYGREFDIASVAYDVQHVDGLPPETVTPTQPDIIARIAAERVKKVAASESRIDTEDFSDGFILPLESPIRTSPFGVQRVLNGEPKPPHYGVDLAAPQGTPIHAPAPGLVVLAEPDLFLEGGLTMIDHGQGLISFYLHQSRLLVAAGQRVGRGQPIGEVGMKGRATGPHLCWRLGWRGRHMDPTLLIGVSAPLV